MSKLEDKQKKMQLLKSALEMYNLGIINREEFGKIKEGICNVLD